MNGNENVGNKTAGKVAQRALAPPALGLLGIRPQRRRPLVNLAIFATLLLGVVFLIDYPLRYFLFPWSLPLGGQPAMIGSWSGEVALTNGVSGTLHLSLAYLPGDDIFGLNIDGLAFYCLGESAGEFELYGKVDRQGNIADLAFRPVEDDPIWLLHMVNSRWSGETLTLSGMYSYDPTAVHIARSDVPEPAFVFDLQRDRSPTSEPVCP